MTKKQEEKQKCFNEDDDLLQRLFKFQKENIHIPKSKQAYGYKYADLDSILEIVSPILQDYGIGYVHYVKQDNPSVVPEIITTIFNSNDTKDLRSCNNFIDDQVKLSGMNKFMVTGSAVTYFRRYHLVTMLGLTTDQDTDAGGAEQNKKNNSKNPTSKPKGRSIQSAKQESEVDYVKIFDNLVSKGKSIEQLNKMFDKYKKNMPSDVLKEVKSIIEKSKS